MKKRKLTFGLLIELSPIMRPNGPFIVLEIKRKTVKLQHFRTGFVYEVERHVVEECRLR